ncbi:hypothetical protein E2562_034515 [Oryza meyeriana var. granulata]|uniref:Phytocyanin domain-containing protein n=1 Tax=Oryza meyeriana var. granulata TaxID=110450 RepID=A0A6G1CWG3_9ORYZ|nr:hypothetical protein E2562_034515 [Oryza meyeriana var. granulata]
MAGAALLFPAAVASAFVLLVVAGGASASPGHVFVVGGGPRGWTQPMPSDETYNHWAARNRFYVGDFLDFKCARNDSLLVVSRDDYKLCNANMPEQRFDGGGDVRFRLNRNGAFYFISGTPGHCDAGQRMTVRVMAEHGDKGGGVGGDAPAGAPSPGDDEDDSGGSFRTPGSGSSAGSAPTPPHGKTSAAAVSPARGGAYHVAVVAAAVLLVFA